MVLNRVLNSTVKCMAETCIRGLGMEGVNTVLQISMKIGIRAVSLAQTGRCRASLHTFVLTSWKGLSSECCTIYVRAQRQDPSVH